MLAIPSACFIVYGIESGGGIMHWHRVFDQLRSPDIDQENIGLIFKSDFLPLTDGTIVQRFLLSKNAKQLTQCFKVVALIFSLL
ncbi:MAG: hypothetical protein AB8V23_04220 [Candidatus Midichloria sp.]|uniref:Sodium:solute symporter family protein n=1 Tax=Hyalomma marginatum TaxID=34627 RepID=A0A8S4C0R5_9ACAR|nr:sodium:solute symporter family protein [Hyalomma marginatum]CAG7592863.1 sodium:solute symporter family protein [Hyalomma marginatum]